ncbi:DNA ligase [Seminavis robusta]|uniref:DNA ligase n=1 Tax=Seminavis robusta TaxID=568900 RepID=A0A9N8DRN1_9STRA|nr:DNA ligase [Seminavis robusta]|eukprot:Sro232_g093790.1 DNA ligase (563) ;mRNA; r:19617-21440
MPRTTRSSKPKKNKSALTKRQVAIGKALVDLLDANDDYSMFDDCQTRDEEFKKIKKLYHRACLKHHPDKGGDAAQFRRVQASFELLKEMHAKKNTEAAFRNGPPPSWEFYQEAETESVPLYRVELAKSARSKCQASGKAKNCSQPEDDDTTGVPEKIAKGEIRIGVLNDQSGTYSRWVHLRCWRVPVKVWLGLPRDDDDNANATTEQYAAAISQMEELLLVGFRELPEEDQQAFVEHCQNKEHWAQARSEAQKDMVEQVTGARPVSKSKKAKKKKAVPKKDDDEEEILDVKPAAKPTATTAFVATSTAATAAASTAIVPAATTTALVKHRQQFVIPMPGRNGASDETVFKGKTFVLTGLFPEIGGGGGLDLGKGSVKAMIESFGGRVTGSISGKTDCLVVGKEPGMSKVSKARDRAKVKLASLHDLKIGLDNGLAALEDFDFCKAEEPMKIQSFSKGYNYQSGGYNGLALQASAEELAIAQGLMEPENKNVPALPASANANDSKPEAKEDAKPAAKKKKAPPKKRQALTDVSANDGEAKASTDNNKKRKTTRAKRAAKPQAS